MPAGHRPEIHVTITDDFPMAQAFVVIEAVPALAETAPAPQISRD
jgi:holo-[acyl-carrier protein] synthase